jgi:hypothetical protein
MSILGTGANKIDVERESDVIFTAAFIGATLFQNERKGGLTWRVDMEPNTDPNKTREQRTDDDLASMKSLNDACSKVNNVVRTLLGIDKGGVAWGLTPTFGRGGMILAGERARDEYAKVDPAYAKTAYTYLTASQKKASENRRGEEMYVGRGAYCGLVLDDDGNAVTAMSTIRTALNQDTPGVGVRWLPPLDAPVRLAQYPNEPTTATWGIIGDAKTQAIIAQEGMRFFPQSEGQPIPLDVNADVAGYAHGMIRCVYETVRIGQGTAFEMSIGTNTFKLASCMSCSSFMMANGVDASSTHLGRGESWAPYYSGESHNPSHFHGAHTIDAAIALCNAKHAAFMHRCLIAGVQAMQNAPTWVEKDHRTALARLREHLEQEATTENTVARDLYLDAMTFHKSDAQRLNSALSYGEKPRPFCNESYDWFQNRPTDETTRGTWVTWVNPLTDADVRALHSDPAPLTGRFRIRAWSPHKGDSCALEYSLLNSQGKEAQKGTLSQGADERSGIGEVSVGTAEFTVAADGNVEAWRIKIGGDRDYSGIKLNQAVGVGAGDRYSYSITAL